MTEYEKYQLQWLIDHGVSISQLINELCSIEHDSDEPIDAREAFERLPECGIAGSLWACEEEWQDCEGEED